MLEWHHHPAPKIGTTVYKNQTCAHNGMDGERKNLQFQGIKLTSLSGSHLAPKYFNPLLPESDQHVSSLKHNTTKATIELMRICNLKTCVGFC